MELNRDFSEFIAYCVARDVRFMIVGGYAVAAHGHPRFTKDLDVWVEASGVNAARVLMALREFGAPLGSPSAEDLSRPGLIFQMGLPPNRIDLLTSIAGVDFAEAWSAREETTYAEQRVPVIGKWHLVQNKKAAGRPQVLLDVQTLEDV